MNKNQEIAKYKAGRIMIIFFVIISVLNCVVLLLFNNGTVVLTSILPQLALSFIYQGMSTIKTVLTVLLMIILPIAINIASYILSKNNYAWLLPSIIVIIGDFVVMVYYLAASNYIFYAIPDLLIEGMILFSIVIAYIKGKSLENDFTIVEEKKTTKKIKGRKLYEYSQGLAKENKTGRSVICYGAFCFLLIALYICTTAITNQKEKLGEVLAFTLSALSVIVAMASYVVIIVKLTPYTSAKSIFFYSENGVLYKANKQMEGNDIVLTDLQLISEKKSEYICSFYNGKKIKRLIIPKCYKGIEEEIKQKRDKIS